MFAVAIAPDYSATPLPRIHSPPKARPYDEYRECLRIEFSYRCVYCLVTEREVAPADDFGGFEIEHFKPWGDVRFKHLKCHYPNLLWACRACNRAKQDVWPDVEELSRGMRFIDPCIEALGSHIEIRGNMAHGVTPAGEYMIDEINLNSLQHIQRRSRRAELMRRFALIEAACQVRRAQGAPAADVDALENELRALKAEVDHTSPPWDAAADCLCTVKVTPKPRRTTRRERKARRLKGAGGGT